MITQLNDNEIFVFGSNTAGLHRGGAAKQAADEFSAERGIGEGFTGKCYAFPTLDGNLNQRSKEELELSRNLLYHTNNDAYHADVGLPELRAHGSIERCDSKEELLYFVITDAGGRLDVG